MSDNASGAVEDVSGGTENSKAYRNTRRTRQRKRQSMQWFDIPKPETNWLVDGLIPSDAHAAVCGKPKSGKSSFIRNLAVSVIKSRPFLGRSVDIPTGRGRVLYLHLDRKDQPWRVADELRQLGITKEESERLILRTAADMPASLEERIAWLQKEAVNFNPTLIIIDLLWQFIFVGGSGANDYNAVLAGINNLQDQLTKVSFKGALVVALHGRKANSPVDQFDDVLGSTAQRGSFSTNIMLTRYRKENIYTISSDQTERDPVFGEIPETVLDRKEDGMLHLLQPYSEVQKAEKAATDEVYLHKSVDYILNHPGQEADDICTSLKIAKKTFLKVLKSAPELWRTEGKGIKGDPLRYFGNGTGSTLEATRLMYAN